MPAWTPSLARFEKVASRVSPWGNEGTPKGQEQPDLPSCLELKEEQGDPCEDKAREGMDDLPGVPDLGREGAKTTEEMADGPWD